MKRYSTISALSLCLGLAVLPQKSSASFYYEDPFAAQGQAFWGFPSLFPQIHQKPVQYKTYKAPLKPQIFLASPQGDGTMDRSWKTFKEPLKLVKYVSENEEGRPFQGTAIKHENLYLFLETGGQTGLDFRSVDFRFPQDSAQDRTLNLLDTISTVLTRRLETLRSLYNKLPLEAQEDRERLRLQIEAAKKDFLIFPRSIAEDNAFYTQELGDPAIGQGLKFGLFPYIRNGDLCDVSSDFEVVAHETGHGTSEMDNPGDFNPTPISGGYLEGVADISGLFHTLSSIEFCKLRLLLSNFNLDVSSFDNVSGEVFAVGLKLKNGLRDLDVDVALWPEEGANLSNGYIGSGTEVHEIGRVLGGIVFDFLKAATKIVWSTLSPSDANKLDVFSKAFFDVICAVREADFGARILKEAPTMSSYFSKMYQLLPVSFKSMGLGDDVMAQILSALENRARSSNVRARPGAAPGADELSNTVFLIPEEETDENAKYRFTRKDGTRGYNKCSRHKKKYAEGAESNRLLERFQRDYGDDLPQLQVPLTRGVNRDLDVVFGSLEVAQKISMGALRLPHVFWPDPKGRETWVPENNIEDLKEEVASPQPLSSFVPQGGGSNPQVYLAPYPAFGFGPMFPKGHTFDF